MPVAGKGTGKRQMTRRRREKERRQIRVTTSSPFTGTNSREKEFCFWLELGC
jgi:hypothetical protein